MKKSIKLALATVLAVSSLALVPTISMAQSGEFLQHSVPSLQLESADVREALHALFKSVPGVSYTIAPDVTGPVTVSLKDVTFEVALQSITKQVDATYRIEGGVVNIIRKVVNETGPDTSGLPSVKPTTTKIIRRIKVRSADPQFIAAMIGQDKGFQNWSGGPELTKSIGSGGGGMGGGMMGGGMGGGMMGGMGGGMGGGMMGGMGGGMMGGMGGGMMGGGGMGGGMMGGGGMGGFR